MTGFELTTHALFQVREQALKRKPTWCGLLAVYAVAIAIPLDVITMPFTAIGVVIQRRLLR